MGEQERYRIHSYMTQSRFLHVEDALDIGKVRLFAGEYRRGQGASATAYHFLDLEDARVLFTDLAWARPVAYKEYKGNGQPSQPVSRVLKVKLNGDKVWFQIDNGPGEKVGQGAVKPKGNPTASVSVPLDVWAARKLAHAVLAHLAAWEVVTFKQRMGAPQSEPQIQPDEGEGEPVLTPPRYGNGAALGENEAERGAFRDYCEAHSGQAPASIEALRAWVQVQK